MRIQRELMPYVLLAENAAADVHQAARLRRRLPHDRVDVRGAARRRAAAGPAARRLHDRAARQRRGPQPPRAAGRGDRRRSSRRATASGARIMSLACGPAREVFDVFETLPDASRLKATLIDFDLQALAHVAERRDRLGLQRSMTLTPENLIHLAIGRKTIAVDEQDLVYSIGLIDYFPDELVVKLMSLIHGLLRPGGKAILGNFHPTNACKAFMDHVLEWRLIHRSEADMDRLYRASAFGRDCTNIRFEDQGDQPVRRVRQGAECACLSRRPHRSRPRSAGCRCWPGCRRSCARSSRARCGRCASPRATGSSGRATRRRARSSCATAAWRWSRPAPPPVVIRVLKRGAVLGELALLGEGARSASVRARRDSELIELRREQFELLIRTVPSFAVGADAQHGPAARVQPRPRRSGRAAALVGRRRRSTRARPPPRCVRDLAGALRAHGSLAHLRRADAGHPDDRAVLPRSRGARPRARPARRRASAERRLGAVLPRRGRSRHRRDERHPRRRPGSCDRPGCTAASCSPSAPPCPRRRSSASRRASVTPIGRPGAAAGRGRRARPPAHRPRRRPRALRRRRARVRAPRRPTTSCRPPACGSTASAGRAWAPWSPASSRPATARRRSTRIFQRDFVRAQPDERLHAAGVLADPRPQDAAHARRALRRRAHRAARAPLLLRQLRSRRSRDSSCTARGLLRDAVYASLAIPGVSSADARPAGGCSSTAGCSTTCPSSRWRVRGRAP